MNTPNTKYESAGTTTATDGHDFAVVKPPRRIEAYGVKGMKSRPWRRTFKDSDALMTWCDENDAVVYGQRFLDGQ
jgi:hypothetical protein